MTRFVVSAYPTEHPGLVRVEVAARRLRDLGQSLSDGRAFAALATLAQPARQLAAALRRLAR